MIHIYTGKGKGKTTCAFGLAMRAGGQGLRVIIFQFLKPKRLVCGEEISVKRLKNIKVVKCEECHPMFSPQPIAHSLQNRIKKAIENTMKVVEKAIFNKKYDIVILDEIINVIDQNFYSKRAFLKLLRKLPRQIELVLTGRGDISEIEEYADYVTIMLDKKHPYRGKVGARRGVEY